LNLNVSIGVPRCCRQLDALAKDKFQRKQSIFSTHITTQFPTTEWQESADDQREVHMIIRRSALVVCYLGLSSVLGILHAGDKADPMALTPAEMKWQSQGGLALAGIEQANLVGDPSKPGLYTIRLKFPAGYRLAPHTHPDYREATILSGTWNTGYGEKFDETALKALPAGSFYTEPANIPHFVLVREPVVIQVSGIGPSGRAFVNPTANPK
jgi:quercetin dioxygenase-like cupin family protein